MKKLIYLFLVLLAFICLAQTKDHLSYYIATPENYTWFGIKGTAADTSAIYETRAQMTLKPWVADTTGTNAVDVVLTFQTAPFEAGPFTSSRTLTMQTDSGRTNWLITQIAIPNESYYRVILTGGATNLATDSVVVEIPFTGFPKNQ